MSVVFDHRHGGTPAAAWQAAGLARLPSVGPVANRLVVLAAHPDDETLGAGGLIAAAARAGAAVTVLVATDGAASHPDSPTYRPDELAAVRRREVIAAVACLAPNAELCLLDLPDGRLAAHPAALDDALDGALGAAGDTGAAGTGTTLLATPWRGDRHPDHEACARAAQRAAGRHDVEHWQFPIWAWHWGDPHGADLPWARLHRSPLDPADLAAKRAALAEHVSQHRPLSDRPGDEPVLSAGMLEHFDRPEEYFVLPAPASRGRYFDELYTAADDPWGLADRFYERRKRAVLLAALPNERFRRTFEPGCATGLLTEDLARRSQEVIAWDGAAAAVHQARRRTGSAHGTRVHVEHERIPHHWPAGPFDLVVLSEVGYYCDDLDLLHRRVLGSLTPDGVLVACHWRHPAPDHPHTAADVHDALGARLRHDVQHVEADFLLDVWSRGGPSVAEADGLR